MLVLERIARMNKGVLPPGTVTSEPKRVDNSYDSSVTTHLLITEDIGIDEEKSTKSTGKNAFQAFWSHDLIRSTLLLWIINFACSFAYYGLVYLTSELSSGRSQPMDSGLYINVLVTSFAGNIVP